MAEVDARRPPEPLVQGPVRDGQSHARGLGARQRVGVALRPVLDQGLSVLVHLLRLGPTAAAPRPPPTARGRSPPPPAAAAAEPPVRTGRAVAARREGLKGEDEAPVTGEGQAAEEGRLPTAGALGKARQGTRKDGLGEDAGRRYLGLGGPGRKRPKCSLTVAAHGSRGGGPHVHAPTVAWGRAARVGARSARWFPSP